MSFLDLDLEIQRWHEYDWSAWDDDAYNNVQQLISSAEKLIMEFTDDDWNQVSTVWRIRGDRWRTHFLEIVLCNDAPMDFKKIVPILIEEISAGVNLLNYSEVLRYFLNHLSKEDNVWRVSEPTYQRLTQQFFATRNNFIIDDLIDRIRIDHS